MLLSPKEKHVKWIKRGQKVDFQLTPGGLVINEQSGHLFYFTTNDQIWSYDPATEKWTLAAEKAFANGRLTTSYSFRYGNNKTLAIVQFWSGAHGLYDMQGQKVLAAISDTRALNPGVSGCFT